MARFILVPVGTSILTNQAGENREILNRWANSGEQEIPIEVREFVELLKRKTIDNLHNADVSNLRKVSAELNGLAGIYEGLLLRNSNDIIWLISTDTYQGRVTAEIVKELIKDSFPNTQVYTPRGLSTKTKISFQTGIKDLLRWCDETINGYRHSGYEVIFNLTGGFKSLQGYLNTIGMFYADRITYIFEQNGELITIPRLPIKLESEVFQRNANIFLQLSNANRVLPLEQLQDIPDVMLEEYSDNLYTLSDWGQLAWDTTKEEILGDKLIELPMIAYMDTFKKDFQRCQNVRERVKLQEVVTKVSCLLQENGGDIAYLKGGRGGGILYDNYAGRNSHIGHFRINQGDRVSCQYDNRILELRHYGTHDYVNDNP